MADLRRDDMATILDLLMALNRGDLPPVPGPAEPIGLPAGLPNVPLAPAPQASISTGPTGPLPEPAPVAPTEPLDLNLMRQIMALAPPEPTKPAPLSRGQRIANALIGFGAGVQGYGPQFLQQLQEPQREYQRRLQTYQNERGRFGLTALEAAQSKQERAQAERQRRADIQAQRDFEIQLDKMKFSDEQARDQARQAFQLELEARKEREAQEKQQRALEAATEKQRVAIENELRTKDGAPSNIAREISEYTVGKRVTLSPAAEKWRGDQAKYTEAKALRLARIAAGGNKQAPPMADIVDEAGNVIGQLPYNKVRLDRYTNEPLGFPAGSKVRTQGQPTAQAPQSLPSSPYFNMGGTTEPLSQGMQPQTQPTFSRAEIKARSRRTGETEAQIKAAILAKGGRVR